FLGDLWNTFKPRGQYFYFPVLQLFLDSPKTFKRGVDQNPVLIGKNLFGTKIDHLQFQFLRVYPIRGYPKVAGMVEHKFYRSRCAQTAVTFIEITSYIGYGPGIVVRSRFYQNGDTVRGISLEKDFLKIAQTLVRSFFDRSFH